MMLWYKAWRETRLRLAISALALAWLCLIVLLMEKGVRADHAPMTYPSYIWGAVYKGYGKDVFVVLVMGLGLGGLLQERAHGTAGFTLALPVSRSRLIAVRAAIGIAESALLALLPALVLPILSPLMGESYPFTQALQFSVLWASCGTVVFGASFFLSTLLAGEYSAWIVCFVALFFYSAIINVPPLENFPSVDFFRIMNDSNMPYFKSTDHLLIGTLPWLPLSIIALVALGWVMVADRIARRQDF